MQVQFNICIYVTYHSNRMKGKKLTIIPTDEGKTFDKIQHHFMIKTLNDLGIEGYLTSLQLTSFSAVRN